MTKDLRDGLTYKDVLCTKCDLQNDELGRVVKDRLVAILGDLPAEEARYHHACNRNFHKLCVKNTVDNEDRSFSETCKVINENRLNIWNSLEIEEVYVGAGGQNLSHRNLFQKVMAHFGDEVVSLHSTGIATLLVFRNHVAKTLLMLLKMILMTMFRKLDNRLLKSVQRLSKI